MCASPWTRHSQRPHGRTRGRCSRSAGTARRMRVNLPRRAWSLPGRSPRCRARVTTTCPRWATVHRVPQRPGAPPSPHTHCGHACDTAGMLQARGRGVQGLSHRSSVRTGPCRYAPAARLRPAPPFAVLNSFPVHTSGAPRCSSAGVHKHGMSSDKLCKRYLFNLEMIVKSKAPTSKKIEGPPRMLYLRELYASIHQVFKEPISAVVRSVAALPLPSSQPRSRADPR